MSVMSSEIPSGRTSIGDISTTSAMPLTRFKRPTSSPITEIPYDVLMEIFTHCLPQHPLEIRQPNTTVAPMLLCQICSLWRTVALTSPLLWSHLSYTVAVNYQFKSYAFLKKEIDFIRWWKDKQGSMAPSLRIYATYEYSAKQAHVVAKPECGIPFILKYLASAQYLHVDTLWEALLPKMISGHQLVSPNLRTLVTSPPNLDFGDGFYQAQALISLTPNYPPSAPRRLFIHNDYYLPLVYNIPAHWSTLTHLSLRNVRIPLNFWFSLVAAVPNLQWAYVECNEIHGALDHTQRSDYVLPQLSTLFICSNFTSGYYDFTPSLLLPRLHLPALRSLSISYPHMDRSHVLDLCTTLQSMPVITTLILKGYNYLSESLCLADLQGAERGAKPIWAYTPHLKDLQLDLPDTRYDNDVERSVDLDTFIGHTFFSDIGLFILGGSTCPIRMITFIDMEEAYLWMNKTKHLAVSRIQERAKASNVIFKFIQKSAEMSAAGVWEEYGVDKLEDTHT